MSTTKRTTKPHAPRKAPKEVRAAVADQIDPESVPCPRCGYPVSLPEHRGEDDNAACPACRHAFALDGGDPQARSFVLRYIHGSPEPQTMKATCSSAAEALAGLWSAMPHAAYLGCEQVRREAAVGLCVKPIQASTKAAGPNPDLGIDDNDDRA